MYEVLVENQYCRRHFSQLRKNIKANGREEIDWYEGNEVVDQNIPIVEVVPENDNQLRIEVRVADGQNQEPVIFRRDARERRPIKKPKRYEEEFSELGSNKPK